MCVSSVCVEEVPAVARTPGYWVGGGVCGGGERWPAGWVGVGVGD